VFLNDNQAIESQIVKLSFEFAKADAALAKSATSPYAASATLADPNSAGLAHFMELKNRNDHTTHAESEWATESRFQVLQAMSSTWDCCNSSCKNST
jgi:hypothetical protein